MPVLKNVIYHRHVHKFRIIGLFLHLVLFVKNLVLFSTFRIGTNFLKYLTFLVILYIPIYTNSEMKRFSIVKLQVPFSTFRTF